MKSNRRMHAVKMGTLFLASVLLAATQATAQEIRVMSSGGFSTPYQEMVPEFERRTQYKVLTAYGASMGGAPDSIPMRLERDEPADVVILAAAALDLLVEQGKVVSGSRVDLVRSKIGMGVRAGTQKPDISTVDALIRTLLNAESIAYSASASGTYLSTRLFPRLGIAEQVREKSIRVVSERVGAVVARGEAEIGFQQISELLPIEGLDYVGPLPDEVQEVTIFSAGIAAGAKNLQGARELIEFLASPATIPAIESAGLEPVASR